MLNPGTQVLQLQMMIDLVLLYLLSSSKSRTWQAAARSVACWLTVATLNRLHGLQARWLLWACHRQTWQPSTRACQPYKPSAPPWCCMAM